MTLKRMFKSIHLPVEKLTVLFLFTVVITLSARAYTQGITLEVKNESLEKVFQEIKKQSGYLFFYENKVLANTKKVNLKVSNVSLEEALRLSFQDQPLSYSIVGKTIVVRPKALDTDIESGDKSIQIITLPIDIKGRLTNDRGEPVEGASIRVKGTDKGTSTNANGEFELKGVEENAVLVISGTNIETVEWKVGGKKELVLIAKAREVMGEEVVVSTGYQDINKTTSTGSFVKIDNELLNRKVSTNVLDRIYEVTSGLNFVPQNSGVLTSLSPINIRGVSTINADFKPLIVVDGFPYQEQDFNGIFQLSNINPNDIESITVLKDAAAASIWGARAGNGVIVITTKRGKYNQRNKVQLTTSINVFEKPDFHQLPIISSADAIEYEKGLFNTGYYNDFDDVFPFSNFFPVVSPTIELLLKQRKGIISQGEADKKLLELQQHNVLDDINRYFVRNEVNQQYAVNFSGGTEKSMYYTSIGFDNNKPEVIGNNSNRLTLRFENNFRPIKNLELGGYINYTQTENADNGIPPYTLLPNGINKIAPYTWLAGINGDALAIPYGLRMAYVDSASYPSLLDWHYRPLDEIRNSNNIRKSFDIRFSPSIKYNVTPGLSIEARYQFQRIITDVNNVYSQKTYQTRELINQYTFRSNGLDTFPIPHGSIVDKSNSELKSKNFRTQINYNHKLFDGYINALAGYETREVNYDIDSDRKYGYDQNTNSFLGLLDFDRIYSLNPSGSDRIPNPITRSGTINRFISYFSNLAYTFRGKYVMSISGRKDGANLFGVKSNQKITPLWSSGLAWYISKESFYRLKWLPALNFRITYGYTGNIKNNATVYATIRYNSNDPVTGATIGEITSPPNPSLRWEKSRILNTGLDFTFHKDILSGSIEFYEKRGTDLIGTITKDPTTGVGSYIGNYANTKGHGFDIVLNVKPIDGDFKLYSTLLFSMNKDKVTSYSESITAFNYVNGAGIVPQIGKPLFSIFSYRWAGLDPLNGDPRGYNSDTIAAYSIVESKTKLTDIIYSGPANPTIFGSLRNTINWKDLSLSFNITYKLGYYFRRSSINYTSLFSNWSGHSDFSLRWKESGDEEFTNVPSLDLNANSTRDNVYLMSDILVEKGDHIRLQDIRLGYDFIKVLNKNRFLSAAQIFAYINNIGILWRANKLKIDPDYNRMIIPPSRSFAIGMTLNF